MASSKLFLGAMLLALIASIGVASDHGKPDSHLEDVPVKAEVELPEENEGSTKATGKNRESQENAEEETAWKENHKKNQVDPNVDGLILLACIVGLVLFIVVLRYMCCTIEQCEEKSKRSVERSLAAKDKVEHTEKEIILHGMKYKSLVWKGWLKHCSI